MAVSYPDIIGDYINTTERFATGGLQFTGYFEPAQIAPQQVAYLYLFLQSTMNTPLTTNIQIEIPQSGGFLRSRKELLAVAQAEVELDLNPAEAGLLILPVTTTEHTDSGEHELTISLKTEAEKGAQRVRPAKSHSQLENALIDSPVGLNLVSSLGATYKEKAAKKASFSLTVTGEPHPPEEMPSLDHTYQTIWEEPEAEYFNQAVKELNLREVKLKEALQVDALYATLFSESSTRFADAGLPLRVGEAIILSKILTYSCQYFLSDPQRRNGLLVPIWEHALKEDVNTTETLDIFRTVGYHHILRLSVAVSFGIISRAFKRHFWPLEERQAVANHIADNIEAAQALDVDFLYLPLLIAGTHICDRLVLQDEDINHTLALMKKAREARTDLFTEKDMAQAKKIYGHILKKAAG